MPGPEAPNPPRVGLPDPSTVVSELSLQAPVMAAGPAGAAAAPMTTYRILRTNQVDPYDDEEATIAAAAPAAAAVSPAVLEETRGHHFRGTARKAAKISRSSAPTEVFADLADLIDSLPAESEITHHHPPIADDASSDRASKEQRNVRVRAFLYAASREKDNDFHLIVGRDPNNPPLQCMTMEISGTPPESSPHFATLKAARDAFKAFFADPDDLPGFGYDFYDPPIPVVVEGSLFFDVTHATGSRPGPQDLQSSMPVIWEVHPISAIMLET